MAYPISDRYKEVIYGGDYTHKLKIWFNDVELENADLYCEQLKIKKRILPESNSGFSLNNFIGQSIELILHNIEEETIQTPIRIEIGTKVDDEFEFVPIGIFNIEDKPTTDKDKITFTAIDNSTKFDFGYNAKPLIDEFGGRVTKSQIFNDICEKAGVTTTVDDFIGSSDEIGLYDNTINARQYISMLAEQSGSIASINRAGELIFVNLKELDVWEIPLDIVESYSYGLHFKIGKLLYESGLIKYETPDSEDDTLYLDASNIYVNENTLSRISSELFGFEIDSFKTGKILGNPAIDPYDLISITDGDKTFVTLAGYTLTYRGNMIQTFATEFTKSAIESNLTKISNASFKKWAKTTIDNINAEVIISVGKVEQLENNFNELEENVTQTITSTYTKTEINKIISGTDEEGKVVSSVTTTSGTFDDKGLTIEETGKDTKTNLNSDGMIIYASTGSTDKPMLTVDHTGVITDNIRVNTYATLGTNSRFEDYISPDYIEGTGVFWVGR